MEAEKSKIAIIPEEELAEKLEREVEPYLESICRKGRCGEKDALYYELFLLPEAKGTIVLSHGYTEAGIKFHEFVYYLVQAGYQCAVIDHRGHGQSVREGHGENVVHIGRFDQYVEDLHAFVHEVVMLKTVGPLYLYGHSMGGCIAARYLEEYPQDFKKAILNAPMLGIAMPIPSWLAVFICNIGILLGKGDHKLFFHKPFKPDMRFEDDCAGSRARFDYYQELRRKTPSLQTSSASYSWTKQSVLAGKKACLLASRIHIPILLFQAEDDTLVSASAQENFIKTVECGQLVKIGGSRHEIYRSENQVMEKYLKLVLDFYA